MKYFILTSILLCTWLGNIGLPGNRSLPLPYAELEKNIRGKYDSYAVFTWEQYIELLEKLSQNKFIVLPLNEMRNTFDNSKVIVGMRHDVDHNPFKALEMARLEQKHKIRSTYFFLSTAEYYGKFSNSKMIRAEGIGSLLQEVNKTGVEIGIHNDLLTVMIEQGINPFLYNKEELKFYRSLGIKINGTASHGSQMAKNTIPNYNIFSDFVKIDSLAYKQKKYPLGIYSLRDFGYKYEAYFIDYNKYYSESGGRWNDKEGFVGIIKKLESSTAGDRIQILTHPDWWGKDRAVGVINKPPNND